MRKHKSGFLHAQASGSHCSVIISTPRGHPTDQGQEGNMGGSEQRT